MRTFQVLENTTMYDPSLHHLRLNILCSFNFSSDDFGLSHHRDYFPLNSILYLPFQVWHSLGTCHVMGPAEPQSPCNIPIFLGYHIFPSGNCTLKGGPATLTKHLQSEKHSAHRTYTELNTGNEPMCGGCTHFYFTAKGPKT